MREKLSSEDKIDVTHMDAGRYEIREDDRVFYLFNPFFGPVLNQVLDNIRRSIQSRPREHLLIYTTPTVSGLENRPYLSLLARHESPAGQRYDFYRVVS
jgi:hypothetical protein